MKHFSAFFTLNLLFGILVANADQDFAKSKEASVNLRSLADSSVCPEWKEKFLAAVQKSSKLDPNAVKEIIDLLAKSWESLLGEGKQTPAYYELMAVQGIVSDQKDQKRDMSYKSYYDFRFSELERVTLKMIENFKERKLPSEYEDDFTERLRLIRLIKSFAVKKNIQLNPQKVAWFIVQDKTIAENPSKAEQIEKVVQAISSFDIAVNDVCPKEVIKKALPVKDIHRK